MKHRQIHDSSLQPQTLAGLQAGRGIASLLVVLFHASWQIMAMPKYWGTTVFDRFFDFGHAGVDFFFVLSGFIIAHIHAEDIGDSGKLKRYIRNRLQRIYPIYWIVLFGTIILFLLPIGAGNDVKIQLSTVIYSIFLFGPFNRPTIVGVAWTLYHEIAFYLVFALIIVRPKLGIALYGLWVVAITLGCLGFGIYPTYIALPINLLFIFGIAAWWWPSRRPVRSPGLLIGVGALLFLGTGMAEVYFNALSDTWRHLLYGFASVMGVVGLVARERQSGLNVPRWLLLLGAASYSIYLTHFPVLSLLATAAFRLGLRNSVPAPIAYCTIVLLAVAFGVSFHLGVERPLMSLLKRRHTSSSEPNSLP